MKKLPYFDILADIKNEKLLGSGIGTLEKNGENNVLN